ncbi:hypothetical protein AB0L05_40910 [Nonomuraea pusilla]|uniref:hypothetical protein n=1 Tax=Nonomuraea pusilla TaxID=46177 RepID=UPI0033214D92
MGAARGVPRWLLLALLVLLVTGVWGMHTLGHAGSHAKPHTGPHDAPSTATPAHVGLNASLPGAPVRAVLSAFLPGTAVQVAAGGFRGEWRSGHRLPDLDPAAVCLAVLTSLLLPLLAAAYVRGRLGAATAAGTRPSGGPVARPPPRGMGIRLTRVSVLRI